MRRAFACFLSAAALLATAPATVSAKGPNGQPFQELQGQVDALKASVDSFFDIFTEISTYYGVDSFFDVFVELRATQEQADANTENIDSFFDIFTEISTHYQVDSFFDVFVDVDLRLDGIQKHVIDTRFQVDSFFDITYRVADHYGVDSFFDVFVDVDLRLDGVQKGVIDTRFQVDSFFDITYKVADHFGVDSFFDVFVEIDARLYGFGQKLGNLTKNVAKVGLQVAALTDGMTDIEASLAKTNLDLETVKKQNAELSQMLVLIQKQHAADIANLQAQLDEKKLGLCCASE